MLSLPTIVSKFATKATQFIKNGEGIELFSTKENHLFGW